VSKVGLKCGNLSASNPVWEHLPAAWSLMLALRSRGLGTAWTTLHLYHEKEVAALLGIPDDVTQVVHLSVAYYTGTEFKRGPRIPARARTYWDVWGQNR
jgi:nitroreductase